MNFFLFVVAFSVMFSGAASAAPGKPMTTSSLSSGDDLATRIETGNGLETGADYVSAFGQVRPEFGVTDKVTAAALARDLHPCQPPAGRYLVSRVKNGATGTRERHVSSSEAALCDDSRNVVVLLKCGNVTRPVEQSAPPPVAVVPTAPSPPVVACSWCGLANKPLQFAPPINPAAFTEQVKVCEDGTPCGAVVEVTKALIYGGAAVGAASLLPGTRITSTVRNTVNGVSGAVPGGPVGPIGGGPVNPPEYPPAGFGGGGNPQNPAPYWE